MNHDQVELERKCQAALAGQSADNAATILEEEDLSMIPKAKLEELVELALDEYTGVEFMERIYGLVSAELLKRVAADIAAHDVLSEIADMLVETEWNGKRSEVVDAFIERGDHLEIGDFIHHVGRVLSDAEILRLARAYQKTG